MHVIHRLVRRASPQLADKVWVHISRLVHLLRMCIRNHLILSTLFVMVFAVLLSEEVVMRLVSLGLEDVAYPMLLAMMFCISSHNVTTPMFVLAWGEVAYAFMLNGCTQFDSLLTQDTCHQYSPFIPLIAQGGGPLSFDQGDQPERLLSFIQWRVQSVPIMAVPFIILLARLPTSRQYTTHLLELINLHDPRGHVWRMCRAFGTILAGCAALLLGFESWWDTLKAMIVLCTVGQGGAMWLGAHIETMTHIETRQLAGILLPAPTIFKFTRDIPSAIGGPYSLALLKFISKLYVDITTKFSPLFVVIHFYIRYGTSSSLLGVSPLGSVVVTALVVGGSLLGRFLVLPLSHSRMLLGDGDMRRGSPPAKSTLQLPPSADEWVGYVCGWLQEDEGRSAHTSAADGATNNDVMEVDRVAIPVLYVSPLPRIGTSSFQRGLINLGNQKFKPVPPPKINEMAPIALQIHCQRLTRMMIASNFEQAPLDEIFETCLQKIGGGGGGQQPTIATLETCIPVMDCILHVGAACSYTPRVRAQLASCSRFHACFEDAIVGMYQLSLPTVEPDTIPQVHTYRLQAFPMPAHHLFMGSTRSAAVSSSIYHLFGVAELVLSLPPPIKGEVGIPTCEGGWVPHRAQLPLLTILQRNLHILLECVLFGEAPHMGPEGLVQGPFVLPPLTVPHTSELAENPTVNSNITTPQESRILILRGSAALLLSRYFEASATMDAYLAGREEKDITPIQRKLRRALDPGALCDYTIRHFSGRRSGRDAYDVIIASLTFVASRRIHNAASDTLFHSHVTRLLTALSLRSVSLRGDEAAIVNGLITFPWPTGWEAPPVVAFHRSPRCQPHDGSLSVSMVLAELCGQPSVWGSTLFDRLSCGVPLLALSIGRCFRGASCKERLAMPSLSQGVITRMVANLSHTWTSIEHASTQLAGTQCTSLDVYNRAVCNTWQGILPHLQILHSVLKSLVYLSRIPHHSNRPFTCPTTPSLSKHLIAKCLGPPFLQFADRVRESKRIYEASTHSVIGRHGVPDPYHILAASGLLQDMWGIPTQGNTVSKYLYSKWSGAPIEVGKGPETDGKGLQQVVQMLLSASLLAGMGASATTHAVGKGPLFSDIVAWTAELQNLAVMNTYRHTLIDQVEVGTYDPSDICVVCLERVGLGTSEGKEELGETSDSVSHVATQMKHISDARNAVTQDWNWRLWCRFNTSVSILVSFPPPSLIAKRMPQAVSNQSPEVGAEGLDTCLHMATTHLPSAGESIIPHQSCLQQLGSANTHQAWFAGLWLPQCGGVGHQAAPGGPRHITGPPPPFPQWDEEDKCMTYTPSHTFTAHTFWESRLPPIAKLLSDPLLVAKVRPCGHVFHHACIANSLLRAQSSQCPTCRQAAVAPKLLKSEAMMEPLQ